MTDIERDVLGQLNPEIPTHREQIAAALNVSISTVGRALTELVGSGAVRKTGRGKYCSMPPASSPEVAPAAEAPVAEAPPPTFLDRVLGLVVSAQCEAVRPGFVALLGLQDLLARIEAGLDAGAASHLSGADQDRLAHELHLAKKRVEDKKQDECLYALGQVRRILEGRPLDEELLFQEEPASTPGVLHEDVEGTEQSPSTHCGMEGCIEEVSWVDPAGVGWCSSHLEDGLYSPVTALETLQEDRDRLALQVADLQGKLDDSQTEAGRATGLLFSVREVVDNHRGRAAPCLGVVEAVREVVDEVVRLRDLRARCLASENEMQATIERLTAQLEETSAERIPDLETANRELAGSCQELEAVVDRSHQLLDLMRAPHGDTLDERIALFAAALVGLEVTRAA